MKYLIVLLLFTGICSSCNKMNTNCEDKPQIQKLFGKYSYTSLENQDSYTVEFLQDSVFAFHTHGFDGLWFPAATLSGDLEGCKLVFHEYENLEKEGLTSPGGTPRYFYDSMSGYGEFYPEEDSIFLYVDFHRTGDFGDSSFRGNLYLKKLN